MAALMQYVLEHTAQNKIEHILVSDKYFFKYQASRNHNNTQSRKYGSDCKNQVRC